jgi:WD40 repeat protein/serine/threonine protein kinase
VNTQTDRAKDIFLDALEIATADDRRALLDRACGADAVLRGEVEDLLAHHARAGSFLNAAAPGLPETVEQSAERAGAVIGPYKLLEPIGAGGFGVVFMAEQQHPIRRRVALKVIKPGMDSREVLARFEAERQALALMDHPNIAKVFDGGETATSRPYFVMELVRGVPITEFCDHNHLGVRERLGLFADVCRAVQHAHQKGVIHRDLKPTNVLVTLHDGRPVPKVIDFGVAKAVGQPLTDKTLFTGFTQMLGTPLYMSPEQAELSGLDVDTRADIYSLGVLLYELLTGTTPFDKNRLRTLGLDEVRRIIREEEPARPSTRISTLGQAAITVSTNRGSDPKGLSRLFRGELDWIAMRALEKDRNRRYESASAFVADVQRYLADEPVQACPPSTGYRLRKFAHRNRTMLVTATLIALVVSAAGAISTALVWRANQDLHHTLERERVDAYFHRITLAHHALAADDLGRALTLLEQCPEDLRGWEWRYLMRLCWVEPLIFPIKADVNGLDFSADGQSIAAACGDGTVKVLNSVTGEVVRQIDVSTGPVFAVAFHPHGNHLATADSGRHVKVWDIATRNAVFTERCDAIHNVGTAHSVAFSHDGKRLASGNEGTVTVWDWENQHALHNFPGHERRAINVAFSHDDRRLASASWRGWLDLWDPEAGGPSVCSFPASREAVHPIGALAFSPDGRRLAAPSFGRRVDVWDTTTGELVHRLPHGGLVQAVAYGRDGQRLASSGEDKIVRIWDPATGREVLALHGHTGNCGCVAFSPDGQRLASASTDGTIRIWDAAPLPSRGGQELLTLIDTDEVWSVAVSPEGDRLLSAGWGKNFAKVWNLQTGTVSVHFSGIRDVVFCVAWHPDGQRIAAAGRDHEIMQVKVWDARTGEEIYPLAARPGEPEYFAVAFSPDRRHLVTGRHNGAVQVWDAETGKGKGVLGTHGRSPVRGVIFSREGGQLATVSSDGVVKFWDATGLDAEQDEPRPSLQVRAHGPCLNAAFSPDGRRFAAGGEKHTVKIWDVQTRDLLRTLEGSRGDVYTLAFSPNGRWIAAAGEGSTVRVWDSHTGALVRGFRGHTALVSSLAFTPDGKRLVSGSRDRTVKVWDVSKLVEVSGR